MPARRIASAIFLVGLAIAACTRTSSGPAALPAAEGRYLVGIFEGVLPCPDCEGIRTRLTLYANGPNDFTRATYSLVESYLGTREGLQRFRAEGSWTRLGADATDADRGVYLLEPDKPSMQRSFGVLDERRIVLLGRDRRPIEPAESYTLTRVDPPPTAP